MRVTGEISDGQVLSRIVATCRPCFESLFDDRFPRGFVENLVLYVRAMRCVSELQLSAKVLFKSARVVTQRIV